MAVKRHPSARGRKAMQVSLPWFDQSLPKKSSNGALLIRPTMKMVIVKDIERTRLCENITCCPFIGKGGHVA